MPLLKKVIPAAVVLVLGLAVYARYHYVLPQAAHKVAAAAPQTQSAAPASGANAAGGEGTDTGETLVGPLADYMRRPAASDSSAASEAAAAARSPGSNSVKSMDHASSSAVSSGGPILPAKFTLTRSAAFSFEVPPHANNPRLTGTYHATGAGSPAQVDLVVLSADQYSAQANGSPGEALFSAEASTGQSIDVVLPITGDTAMRYYVVFRGDAKTKKVVTSSLRLEM